MANIREELSKALAEEFEVDLSEISPEAEFAAVLGLDSLDMVDVVVLIEGISGVKLAKTDFKEIKTFDDLFSLIEKRMA